MSTTSDSSFASIDIGSHTLRLLVASCKEMKELVPFHLDRHITRLAQGFQENQTLRENSIKNSIDVLKKYDMFLKQHHVNNINCGATGVVRRALNSGDFLSDILEKTGIEALIISEESEAFLSAKGALSVLPLPTTPVVIFDLGGSSTEFLLVDPNQPRPLLSTSVFIGAATITEQALRGDPPDGNSLAQSMDVIQKTLEPTLKMLKDRLLSLGALTQQGFQIVGTAGTVTTLAAIFLGMEHYQPHKVNGLQLKVKWLTTFIDHLAGLPLALRRKIPGLEKGREDIILGGALIVRTILQELEKFSFTITDAGLLEGLLITEIEKRSGDSSNLWSSLTWRWQDVEVEDSEIKNKF